MRLPSVRGLGATLLLTLAVTAFPGGSRAAGAASPPAYSPAWLDSMAVDLQPGSGRPYLFSGTGTTFFYGTTRTFADEGWMGFHWGNRKLFDDFIVMVNDTPLDRAKATVSVRPHTVSFRWPEGYVLTISPMGVHRNDLKFNFSGVKDPGAHISLFIVFPADLTVVRRTERKAAGFQTFKEVAAADTFGIALCSDAMFKVVELRHMGEHATPGSLASKLLGRPIHGVLFIGDRFEVILTYGNSPREMGMEWKHIEATHYQPLRDRSDWLLSEINRSFFRCSDERINKAVSWAKVSLASLFAENETLLWAGLPWFNDGWARDTFISLPGACLVQGKFDAAARILRRFAEWQDKDSTSHDYGKVPNRARFGEIDYNTADGTPWFVRELYEFGLYSGDRDLWGQMMAPGGVVERSIEGTLKYRVDKDDLLVHKDTETWMDAAGSDGAWSPRGNRAVDVEALWLTQLEAAVQMEKELRGDKPPSERELRWQAIADSIRAKLPRLYVRPDGRGLYDHLNADGTPDTLIRPNQLFALTVPLKPVFSKKVSRDVVRTVRKDLVYRYGVASLAQSDANFHPYHRTWHYPKDAAYHNGIVWGWLSGPYKTASHIGWGVAESEIDQILDWGAVGTLSENLDAVPREGDRPNTSGTISQTWSLAEFLRSWNQDYIGVRPVYGDADTWAFDPHLPEEWGNFTTLLRFDSLAVRLDATSDAASAHFRFSVVDTPSDTVAHGQTIRLIPFGAHTLDADTAGMPVYTLSPDSPTLDLTFPREGKRDVEATGPGKQAKKVELYVSAKEDEPFLTPEIRPALKSLQPPPWPLLDGTLVTTDNPAAKTVFDVSDPTGDDTGDGGYGYPTDSHFAEGIFDITRFAVSTDGILAYFTLDMQNLVDPGWHPEYGFQLTFAALAIRTGEKGRKTRREVGKNSNYTLPRGWGADRFVYVGGGLLVRDASGKTLAEYVPRDPAFPLGDVQGKKISFALPLSLIGGDPSMWKVTVLVGAQDDHGGAGIGEFRKVSEKGGAWEGSGGGPGKSNVYDVLTAGK